MLQVMGAPTHGNHIPHARITTPGMRVQLDGLPQFTLLLAPPPEGNAMEATTVPA